MNSIRKNIWAWRDSHRYLPALLQEFRGDLFHNRDTTFRQKIWAYRRGFRSSKIIMYGLNDQNYTEYLSDYDYHRMQPINGIFRKWIDDKLTLKYILRPFNNNLPQYFYQLTNRQAGVTAIRLMDCPEQYSEKIDDVLKLLQAEGVLAAKLTAGQFGAGFYKISCLEKQYYINNRLTDENGMIEFLQTLHRYILTEYLSVHSDLAKISPNGSSVRILTVREEGRKPQIAGSFVRFSTVKSGLVDNISAGGVAALVNVDTGYFHNGRKLVKDEWAECPLHPDTKAVMEGTLPYWDQITTTVLAICNYIPQIRYMGFDIIITDYGFKIIEINSLPGIALHNYYCPMFTNDNCKDFFKQLIAEKSQ